MFLGKASRTKGKGKLARGMIEFMTRMDIVVAFTWAISNMGVLSSLLGKVRLLSGTATA